MKPSVPPRPKKHSSSHKLKLLCVFPGLLVRLHPAGHTRYVDGENRLISIDRRGGIGFSKLASRLSELCPGFSFSIKYHLSDASRITRLVPITTDEDVRKMIEDHDRVAAEHGKAPRIRIYLCDVRSCSLYRGFIEERWDFERGDALGELNERTHGRKNGIFCQSFGVKGFGTRLTSTHVNGIGKSETCGMVTSTGINHSVGSSLSDSYNIKLFPAKVDNVSATNTNRVKVPPVNFDHCPAETSFAPVSFSSQSHKRHFHSKCCGGTSGLSRISHWRSRNHRFEGNDIRQCCNRCCDIWGRWIGLDDIAIQCFWEEKISMPKSHSGLKGRWSISKFSQARVHQNNLLKMINDASHNAILREHPLQPKLGQRQASHNNVQQNLFVIGFGQQELRGDSVNQNFSQVPCDVSKCQAQYLGPMNFVDHTSGAVNPPHQPDASFRNNPFVSASECSSLYNENTSYVIGENHKSHYFNMSGFEEPAVLGMKSELSSSSSSCILSRKNEENVAMNIGDADLSTKLDLGHVTGMSYSEVSTKLDNVAEPIQTLDDNSFSVTLQSDEILLDLSNKTAVDLGFSQQLCSLLERVSLDAERQLPPPSKEDDADEKVNAESATDICSKEVGENTCALPSIYSLLVTQELQTIKTSDLEELRELGSGTYGTVFYGKWKGSDVAIKRLRPNVFGGGGFVEERMVADFWKEAHLLGQLHHPNVVAFYGVVTDGPESNLAMVTEYMVNGSLKQVLKRKDRTIDRRKRMIIAMDAAFGMEYLHEKNIVHFDLKSHNFFVNMRDPHRPVCKIGDLGLSKVKQRTLVSGGVRGTIPWMAPELFSSTSNTVTEKVDVYSFGIVMWELLTGEEPYGNIRSEEIIAGIIKGDLRPEIPNWCDPAWRSLMERCWSSDPHSRPPFSEIAKQLRGIAASINIK
ncbi:uncharacterized protein [Typha latifolia]|uniref:uncharacterized protein n=1 Tax=Typha latifolia TaxID=4733 RepID=UPI003C2C6E3B